MTTETTQIEESVTHEEIDPSIEDMISPAALVEAQSQIDSDIDQSLLDHEVEDTERALAFDDNSVDDILAGSGISGGVLGTSGFDPSQEPVNGYGFSSLSRQQATSIVEIVNEDVETIKKIVEILKQEPSQEQVGNIAEEPVTFGKTEATSIVRNILNKQYPFTQANAEKVLVALIQDGLVTNVRD